MVVIERRHLSTFEKNTSAYIECYGCNEGQLECAHLQSYLKDNGYRVIEDPKTADLIILWACALTKEKAEASRLVVWKLSELKKPGSKILVWGCLPSIDPALIPKGYITFGRREICSLERLIGGDVKYNDVTVNHLFQPKVRRWAEIRSAISFDLPSYLIRSCRSILCGFLHVRFAGHEKIFHIMTAVGCLSNCTYCSEKVSCWNVLSKPKEKVLAEFKMGLEKGYHYFALSATDIGAYGRDLGYTVCDLLGEITETKGDYNLLLYNINPVYINEMSKGLQKLLETGKIAMLGISAECASDRLLKLMGRRYTAQDYEVIIRDIRAKFPNVFLKTEVMVGFPTEREEDFRTTIRLLESNLFDHIDVFKFSRRPTTAASRLKGQVPDSIIKRRYRQMMLKALMCEIHSVRTRRSSLNRQLH